MRSSGELGLVAAPFTAFGPDGSLALDVIDQQAAALAGAGVRGVFVCGTTGEASSLTTQERMQVAERWVAAAGERLEVIVHAGHNSLVEAARLAAHAAAAGASAVAAVPPSFHRPASLAALVDCAAEVAAAAGGLPFFYYHVPDHTGVRLPMPEFLQAARKAVPGFAGIKFTDGDLVEYGRCLDAAGEDLEIFFGRDELLLAALALGARSAVGSTYNFLAPLYQRLAGALDRGDLATARRLQALVRDSIGVALAAGGLPALKALAGMLGPDCGPCRLPLVTLDPAQRTALHADLERVGLFDELATVDASSKEDA